MHHIHEHYHYIRGNLEEGIVNIEFVESIQNNYDNFKKNISQEIHDKHVTKFLGVNTKE
jgi:hypothetical protein